MSIKVHLAEEAGFCFGVEKAIELAKREARVGEVCTFGELVHNQDVVAELEDLGIRAGGLDETGDQTVLIRAHGISTADRQALIARSGKVVDATCPMVLGIKAKIDAAVKQGSLVILFGRQRHPEAIGLKDDRDRVVVIEEASALDANELRERISTADSVTLVAQSTMPIDEFNEIETRLLDLRSDAELHRTICSPTRKRQQAVLELARKLPLVIVVGDAKSSNTDHLLKLASQYCRAERVMAADELRAEWFEGIAEVGLSAGASTPRSAIESVAKAIEDI